MDRQADRRAYKRNDRQIDRQAKILVCDFYNKMDFFGSVCFVCSSDLQEDNEIDKALYW